MGECGVGGDFFLLKLVLTFVKGSRVYNISEHIF